MNIKYLTLIVLFIFSVYNAFAQNDIEMADMFMENGKIWVVVAVIVIIFAGICAYLITLDKRLRKLEKSK